MILKKQEEIERKPVFSGKNVFLFVLQLCILTTIIIVIEKNILFKWKFLKYFNALDCMMYILALFPKCFLCRVYRKNHLTHYAF